MPGQEKLSGISDFSDFKNLPAIAREQKIRILKQNYTLPRSCITLDELKQISNNKLVTIGSHTVSHPVLNRCSFEQQNEELNDSKKILQDWLKTDINFLAYPNGDYNQDTIDIAVKAGYKLAFTVVPDKVDVAAVNPYLIPRYCIDDHDGYFDSIAKILGVWQKYRRKVKEVIS
jgi:peptidoglycan/xylan/chitin deacetylase (PgdA/CDA1 family)